MWVSRRTGTVLRGPLTVLERCDALERDAEFVGVQETRGVVEEFDVLVKGEWVGGEGGEDAPVS